MILLEHVTKTFSLILNTGPSLFFSRAAPSLNPKRVLLALADRPLLPSSALLRPPHASSSSPLLINQGFLPNPTDFDLVDIFSHGRARIYGDSEGGLGFCGLGNGAMGSCIRSGLEWTIDREILNAHAKCLTITH